MADFERTLNFRKYPILRSLIKFGAIPLLHSCLWVLLLSFLYQPCIMT